MMHSFYFILLPLGRYMYLLLKALIPSFNSYCIHFSILPNCWDLTWSHGRKLAMPGLGHPKQRKMKLGCCKVLCSECTKLCTFSCGFCSPVWLTLYYATWLSTGPICYPLWDVCVRGGEQVCVNTVNSLIATNSCKRPLRKQPFKSSLVSNHHSNFF